MTANKITIKVATHKMKWKCFALAIWLIPDIHTAKRYRKGTARIQKPATEIQEAAFINGALPVCAKVLANPTNTTGVSSLALTPIPDNGPNW